MRTTAIAAAMQNVPIPNTASALRGWARKPSSSATPPAMAAIGTAQSSTVSAIRSAVTSSTGRTTLGSAAGALVAHDLDQLLPGDLHLVGPRPDQAGVGVGDDLAHQVRALLRLRDHLHPGPNLLGRQTERRRGGVRR